MGLTSHTTLFPALLLCLALYCTPAAAFGAGNIASISKIEGQNWRHGDLEDTLLQLFLAAGAAGGRRRKFSSMDVKRVYFGNWLRDYSQAIDTGALKYVEAEAVRILLWVLSFMTFGYATREFEVTAERLGCYRPEEHIDNPKDYNDNNDARRMHSALRGPVDEEVELGIDPETGLKNYIANETIEQLSDGEPMATSAQLVRRLFTKSIELGRQYAQSGREEDLFEAFRLMGTGLHCIEDFSAHSNYTELALIELGENDVFPHVGANTMVNVQGREIWPLVTGTFGGVDFLHSVLGEVNDKALQSEISQLEHAISEAQRTAQNDNEQSIIRDLMSKLNIGGKDDIDSKTSELKQKSDAQKEATESGEPFGLSQNARQLGKDIYPFLEFHDELMRSINQALESVGLDIVMEKLAEAVSVFVFCLLAPYILPIIGQASNELKAGSSEVIASSQAKQHIVFDDDYSSDPTHSMLSKDHFTNLLNEPAGKVASAVLKFAVPLLMNAWDDDGIDPDQVCDEIIGGVFHHPAFRNGEDGRPGVEGRQMMFAVIEEWWGTKDSRQQDELRRNLSREGVQQGYNHKQGVHDSGHGCGAPIHRSKPKNRGGDIGGAVGESVGMALENALSGGKKGGDGGLGGMLGSMLGGAISQRFVESSGGGGSRTESYSPQQESSSYVQTSSYGGEERFSYSTRELYETPEYSRTTERHGGSGREPEEIRYESRREYTHEDCDQPSYDYQRGGEDEYEQPQCSYGYGQQEERHEQPQYSYGGDDERRGDQQQYSYGGERQDYYGGMYEGGYSRRGTTQKHSFPFHSHSTHFAGYSHGSSDVFLEKEEKKKKDKKKKKGGDEEDEEEADGRKYKEKGKKGKYEYRQEDEDEDEFEKKKKDKKDKKKSYEEDEEDGDDYEKKKKDKKHKKKFKDEDGDGEDDDEEWGKKKKDKKKYDDEEDEDEDEGYGKKKKEKKSKEKGYSGGEEEHGYKRKEKKSKEKEYSGGEEEHGYKKKDRKSKEKYRSDEEDDDDDDDDDYKKKKDNKKKYKY